MYFYNTFYDHDHHNHLQKKLSCEKVTQFCDNFQSFSFGKKIVCAFYIYNHYKSFESSACVHLPFTFFCKYCHKAQNMHGKMITAFFSWLLSNTQQSGLYIHLLCFYFFSGFFLHVPLISFRKKSIVCCPCTIGSATNSPSTRLHRYHNHFNSQKLKTHLPKSYFISLVVGRLYVHFLAETVTVR